MSNSPNYEREEAIARKIANADLALRMIANYGDCLHQDAPDEDKVCSCPVCIATNALATETEWRYDSNNAGRRQFNPREAAMADAWRRYMKSVGTNSPDIKLASILGFDKVTPHDWLVASTLIQWIVTNVGSSLLHECGYRYDPPKLPEPKDP